MAGEFVIGNMVAKLAADTSDFIKDMTGAGNVAKDFKKSSGEIDKGTKQIGSSFKSLGSILGSAAITGGLIVAGEKMIGFLKDSVVEAEAAAKAQAQLEAVIKSTGGAAGVTAQDVNDMAAELMDLTGVEDDLIVKQSAVMLTFTKISEDIFPDAMQAALDMSAAMGQDLQSSVVQLGKALNDPIEGAGALRRVGVQLTDEQEDLIKSLMEGGRVAEAQGVILQELQKEFGGTAAAMHEAGTGSDDLKNSIGNLKEEIGKGLIPTTKDANELLSDWVNQLTFGVSAENALVDAAKKGLITMEEANNQVNKFTWTSYTAADAIDWLKKRLQMYYQIVDDGIKQGDIKAAQYDQDVNGLNKVADATKDVTEANKAAEQSTKDWMSALDTGLENTIANWLDELAFMAAGGGEVQAAAEGVKAALLAGSITPDEAKGYFNELYVQAELVKVEMGEITADQAAKNIRDTLGVSLQEALKLVKQVKSAAQFNVTSWITVKIRYEGNPLGVSGGILAGGHAAGGTMQAGEIGWVGEKGPELFVAPAAGTVIPNHQVGSYLGEGEGGGDTYNEITIINNDRQTAALSMAMLQNSRLTRLNAGMG